MKVYTVLISCQDRAGLVNQISGVLFRNNLNITSNQEFVDHTSKRFFMRTQFEGEVDQEKVSKDLKAILPNSAFCEIRSLVPRKIVVMVSKEPHCLGDLLLRHSTGDVFADILAVISQFNCCRSLTDRFGIPFIHIPVMSDSDRLQHEEEVLKALAVFSPEYLVLARYMRIFSAGFVGHYPDRIINIHHSFLPAFIGRNPYEQAYERGVKMIGATAHFVTDVLDEGPIIKQGVIQVNHTLEPAKVAKRGQDVERVVLANALNLVFEDRVLIDGQRTIVFE